MIEIIAYKEVKARKEHQCDWCLEKIKKGDRYSDHTIKNDYVYHWKSHLHCDYLYDHLYMSNSDDGDGIDSDTFREYVLDYLREHFDEEMIDDVKDEALAAYTLMKAEKGTISGVSIEGGKDATEI